MEAFQKKISWRDLAFREGIISDAQRRTQKSQFSAQLVARREEQQKCEEALRDLEVQSQNIEKEEARIEERKKTHPIYQPNFPKEKIVDLFLSYRLSGSKMSMFDGMFDDEAKGSSSATKSVAAPEEPQPLDVTAAKNEQLDSATEASQSLLDSNFAALVDSGETDEVLEQYKAIVAEAEAKIRALQQTNTGDEETANKAKENDAEENDTELMSH
ncbi:hypothetical protein AGDE_12781 [Angomonas deanei]|nr:hypothetical protein AGDE_12781 [Angomonas deanei]|eukprot:EPY23515.1 hypothetical protein AGDE_12781 [Angomonas deanei]